MFVHMELPTTARAADCRLLFFILGIMGRPGGTVRRPEPLEGVDLPHGAEIIRTAPPPICCHFVSRRSPCTLNAGAIVREDSWNRPENHADPTVRFYEEVRRECTEGGQQAGGRIGLLEMAAAMNGERTA